GGDGEGNGDYAGGTDGTFQIVPVMDATALDPLWHQDLTQTLTLAAFSDVYGSGDASDYTAQIDWGDGSAPESGIIGTNGTSFWVAGVHLYVTPLGPSYTAQVAITHTSDGNTAV